MFEYEGVRYPDGSSAAASKVCFKGFTASGGHAIIHKNVDYPVWELNVSSKREFPCACGRWTLDKVMQVKLETLPDNVTVHVPVRNETVIKGFLGQYTRPFPKILSGTEITDELNPLD